ncbi:MAG: hypothetical protein IPF79_04715 [Ignavibacteria bacterium]|nr:hypothetical protein [Ignavibacteria bacterium]
MAVLVEEHRRLLMELDDMEADGDLSPTERTHMSDMMDQLLEYEAMEQGEYEKIVEAQRHMAKKMQSSGTRNHSSSMVTTRDWFGNTSTSAYLNLMP